jgi:hypothetical protein
MTVTKEVQVVASGPVKMLNSFPALSGAVLEFKHKYRTDHGSSIFLTLHSLALAHMRRLTRTSWLSGLINFSFNNERLTPKQLSLFGRYHPSGFVLADDTVVTMAFDSIKIGPGHDVFNHGKISISAISKFSKHVVGGLQISHATGNANDLTVEGGFWKSKPKFDPIVKLGLEVELDQTKFKISAKIDSKYLKEKSEVKASVEQYIEPAKMTGIFATTYSARSNSIKWTIGAYSNLL